MREGGRPGRTLGLAGMRERAKRIGAQIGILERSGAGTEVELSSQASIAYGTAPAWPTSALPTKKANS